MLLKGAVLLAVFAVVSGLRRKGYCRDDMLTIADGRYSCSMLIDRNHPQGHLGAYTSRVNLCSRPGHSGCCKTCRENGLVTRRKNRNRGVSVRRKKPGQRHNGRCRDRGLNIADGSYSCRLLTDQHHWKQQTVGAFRQRAVLCSRPDHSGCCRTCTRHDLFVNAIGKEHPIKESHKILTPPTINKGIHLDDECKDSGLNIAGGYYDCTLLVDVNHASQSYIGAYGSRQKLCNLANQSGCCRTCTMHGLYAPKPQPTKSHLHDNKETHKEEETTPSFCRDTGLRIADGSYDCAMLIDKEYRNQAMIGAYSARHKLCSRRMFSGCCNTCQRHVIGRTRRHCKDEYVVVLKNKSTYTCRELLQRKSDIYSDRFELCADTVNTKCCKACKKGFKNNEGLTHYTNLVNKPTGLDSSTKDGSQNTSNIDTKEVGSTLKPYVNGNAKEAGSTLPLNANVDTKVGSTLKPNVNGDAKEAGSKLPLNANIVTEEAGSTRSPNAEVEVSDGHKVFQLMMELIKRFNKFKAFTKKDLKALTHALESIRNGQS